MKTRQDVEYWTGVKPGDYINLTDIQSFEEAGTTGVDYRVRDVRKIGVSDRDSRRVIAEYYVHELERDRMTPLYFTVVRAEEDFELRVYFMPSVFLDGTRDDLIDHGHTWFFLPPPDPEDFISSDLEYAPYPDVPPLEEGAGDQRSEFSFSGFGRPVFGSYRRGREEVPAIITEYATEDDVLNPLIMIIEERWVRPDGTVPPEGGFITPLLGCQVERESAEIFPA